MGYNAAMRSGTLAILTGSLAWACFAGRAVGETAAEKAWRELFAQPGPAAAEKQIGAVLAACENDVTALRRLIAADAAYEAFEPGWKRAALRVGKGPDARDVAFFLRVPRGYDRRKSYPLLLGAHWKDGTGDAIGRSMEVLLGAAVEQYVLVAPTMPDPQNGFAATEMQVQAYLRCLAWARVNLNVDDDRIYVAGYGQGGSVAWHLAVMYPRLFAAAVPMAGVPHFQGAPYTLTCYLENVEHLPVWAVWGAKDAGKSAHLGTRAGSRLTAARLKKLGNTHFRGTELPTAGHARCWPKSGDFGRFLSRHKRNRVPAKFRRYFHLPAHARGYCVEAVKGGRRPFSFGKPYDIDVPSTQPHEPTSQELFDAASRHLAKRLFKMWVDVDRARNALRVRPMGVTKVRVFITDGLFDLGKPVELRFARAKWQGRMPLSARCMLLHYAATRDATGLVYNEIDLQILGKSAARYP